MEKTRLLRALGKAVIRTALLVVLICLALHVVASVSMPLLQAFGEGLQRANNVQVVAASDAASAIEVAR